MVRDRQDLIWPDAVKAAGLRNGVHDEYAGGVGERTDDGEGLPVARSDVSPRFDDVCLVGGGGEKEVKLVAAGLHSIY